MTTGTTIHEKVTQAIMRDAELQGQLAGLLENVTIAKQAEDKVRLSTTLADAKAAFGAARAEAVAKAEAIQKAAKDRAQKPYDEATAKYNTAIAAALGAFNKIKEEQDALYESQVAVVLKQCTFDAAEAKAGVHNAQQQVAAHRSTLDMHRRNILERLGINMGNLLER